MPVMSRVERAFCCSPLWSGSNSAVARTLRADQLSGDVLEIGSGGGGVAGRLHTARPDLTFTATDLDPVMVAAAQRRLQGLANVSVETADCTALPFPDDSFDTVLSCLMLHHVIDWEKAVDEVNRVLRPGGRFLGYDLTPTTAATALHRLDRSPFRLVDPDQLTARCEANGMTTTIDTSLFGHVMQFETTFRVR